MYSIYYHEMLPDEDSTLQQEIKINDVLKTHHVFSIRCDTQYVVLEVSAWNVFGQSQRSKNWTVRTRKSTTSEKFLPTRTLVIPFVGCVCVEGGGGGSFQLRAYKKMEAISDHQLS